MLVVWFAGACTAESVLSGQTVTHHGRWAVVIADELVDAGTHPVELTVTEADAGTPADGLAVYLRPGMPDMSHLEPVTYLEGVGEGRYAAELELAMPGVWSLVGYVQDGDAAESFTLVIEALP